MKQISEEILQPLSLGKQPFLSNYLPTDIVVIWDYGPIGYKGQCWHHQKFDFFIAKLDGYEPWIGIIPDFGVSQLRRMLVASHKINGFRSRGGGNRRATGYARYFFEYRSPNSCVVVVLEDNHSRDAAVLRCHPFNISLEQTCTWEMFDVLYPEKER